MPQPDWRLAAPYASLRDLGASGWAWEFLRRNPAYRDDYRAAKLAPDGATPEEAAVRWGLRFFVRP